MAQRDIGVPLLVIYLLIWWGLLGALVVYATANSAPGAPQLAWSEEVHTTASKLQLEIVTDAPDPDGDPIDYTFVWKRDGEVVEGKIGKSITSRDHMKGETWEVFVTPDDGTKDGIGCSLPWRECAGGVVTSLSAVITNTPPRARIRIVDAEGTEIEEYDPKKGNDLHLALSCFDPDVLDAQRRATAEAAPEPEPAADGEPAEKVDPCTYTIGWYPVTGEEPEPVEGEEAVEPEPAATEPMLPASLAKTAPAWKIKVIANDGEEDGEVVEETIAAAEQ